MKQTIFALLTIILLSACNDDSNSNYKYKFSVFSGGYTIKGYANDYRIDNNGCVHFLDKDNDSIILCGSFIISENHKH